MVDVLSTTPARLFGLRSKGAVEVGKDADLVLLDPDASRVIDQAELHHTSDFTPYQGLGVRGAVRSVLLRGEEVVRDGEFVGRRGAGRFVERSLDSEPAT
jgi:dihydropyrimidinase